MDRAGEVWELKECSSIQQDMSNFWTKAYIFALLVFLVILNLHFVLMLTCGFILSTCTLAIQS